MTGSLLERLGAWRRFDSGLLLGVTALMVIGVVTIASAVLRAPDLADAPRRQALYGLAGLLLIFLIASVNYRTWGSFHQGLYVLVLALLLLALIAGRSQIAPVRRWLEIASFNIQPAELAKPLLILSLGRFLADREERLDAFRTALGAFAYMLLPAALIFLQPNLSTAVVVLAIGLGMLFAWGLRPRHLLAIGLLGLPMAAGAWTVMLPYMRGRLLHFLGLQPDPNTAYNLTQALITIGSGGLWGTGWGQSPQNIWGFLRVRHTDFIFAVLAGEFGLVGAVGVLALYLWVLWRIFQAAWGAEDTYGRLIAVGVGTWIAFQALANIGMNLGLMPVAGLPLPFISYGGSALLSFCLGIGLVQSIRIHREAFSIRG
ncbi:MAG: rod shape-determining protein RodA [Thermoflexus sp.]